MQKNKKVLIIAAVVLILIAAALFFIEGSKKPVPIEGAKTITVTVMQEGVENKVFTIHTDAEFLRGALEQEKLVEGTESQYGLYVTTVGGVAVDDEKVTDVYANVPKSAFEKGYVVIKKGKKKFHKAVL